MKLEYFDLLSPDPINIQNVGGILSPKLRDISSIGINTYQYYLGILMMDVNTYFHMNEMDEQYDSLSDEEKSSNALYNFCNTCCPNSSFEYSDFFYCTI